MLDCFATSHLEMSRFLLEKSLRADAWMITALSGKLGEAVSLSVFNEPLVQARHKALEERARSQAERRNGHAYAPAAEIAVARHEDQDAVGLDVLSVEGASRCCATLAWTDPAAIDHVGASDREIARFVSSFAHLLQRQEAMAVRNLRLQQVLDCLNIACLLVDQDAAIVAANRAAAWMAQARSGPRTTGSGRVAGSLAELVQIASRRRGASGRQPANNDTVILGLRLPGDRLRPAYVAPIALDPREPPRPAGERLLVVLVPQEDLPDPRVLEVAFDLTPAEARLAGQIVRGRSVQEAAKALSLTEQTARTYLKRIFCKAGVSRQSELGALVARMHVPMQLPGPAERAVAGHG